MVPLRGELDASGAKAKAGGEARVGEFEGGT